MRLPGSAIPASFAQRRLWFLDRQVPSNPLYNVPYAVRLRGPLDIAALQQSLNEIVFRHEILRTTFSSHQGEPVQIIHPEFRLHMKMHDFTSVHKEEREILINRLMNEEARRTFDVVAGPLFRATLFRLQDDDHILVLNWHHIIFDCWSI